MNWLGLRDKDDRRFRGCPTMSDKELRRLACSVARRWADSIDLSRHTPAQTAMPTKE